MPSAREHDVMSVTPARRASRSLLFQGKGKTENRYGSLIYFFFTGEWACALYHLSVSRPQFIGGSNCIRWTMQTTVYYTAVRHKWKPQVITYSTMPSSFLCFLWNTFSGLAFIPRWDRTCQFPPSAETRSFWPKNSPPLVPERALWFVSAGRHTGTHVSGAHPKKNKKMHISTCTVFWWLSWFKDIYKIISSCMIIITQSA